MEWVRPPGRGVRETTLEGAFSFAPERLAETKPIRVILIPPLKSFAVFNPFRLPPGPDAFSLLFFQFGIPTTHSKFVFQVQFIPSSNFGFAIRAEPLSQVRRLPA